jgi:hypothetical protein
MRNWKKPTHESQIHNKKNKNGGTWFI